MLLNYLKTIYRDLRSNKLYAFISIFGLAVGISISIVLATVVMNFTAQDKFHEKDDVIYQAFTKTEYKQSSNGISTYVSCLLGEALKTEIPEIINATSLNYSNTSNAFVVGNQKFNEKGLWGEPSLFSIFSFPFVNKLNNNVFIDLNSITISESLAKKYFGTVENALGKTIIIRSIFDKTDVTVSSVFKDIPKTSSIKFDYLLPLELFKQKNSNAVNWGNLSSQAFVEVSSKADITEINKKIKNFIDKHASWNKSELFLYKFSNVFLEPPGPGGNKKTTMYVLFTIAVSILLIASINFINMSISRTTKKTKEVGLRKVIGAQKKSIIIRFLGESFFISLTALFLALFFAEILVKYINESFLGYVSLFIPYSNSYFYLVLIMLVVMVSILSGIYPAFFLSSFTPINILKGSNTIGKNPVYIRKLLMVVQFVFSGVFLIFMITSVKQLNYIQNKDLGLDIDNVVSFEITNNIEKHFSAFKHDLELNPRIKTFTAGSFSPTQIYANTSSFMWEGKPEDLNDMFPYLFVSDDFIDAFDIKMSVGRDFLKGDSADIGNFIINEKMAEVINKGNPVGLKASFWGMEGEIVGVVKNFHDKNLMSEIAPLTIIKNPSINITTGFVKFSSVNTSEVLNYLKNTFEQYEDEYPLNISFVKEDFKKQHVFAVIFQNVVGMVSLIAVIISCLGLFGLTAFTTEQKRKEIGIRKVLGASVGAIVYLLSGGLLKLVAVSFVISLPIGYWLIKNFLGNFAYHADFGFGIFFISFCLLFITAFLTVFIQSIRAANANPVDSLRAE